VQLNTRYSVAKEQYYVPYLSSDGRLVAPAGAKVYGIVSAADSASKMKGTASLSVTLTDMQVGGQVLSIKTQPLSVKGGKGTGRRSWWAAPQAFTLAAPFQVELMTNVAVG
jgi:hypothetical protein